jgi:hypothetical protein
MTFACTRETTIGALSMRKIALFVAVNTLLLFAHSAIADSVIFSYSDKESGVSFQGTFLGVLQDDQNSFIIESVDSFSYVIDPRLLPDAGPESSGSWNLAAVLGGDYFWFAQFGDKPQGNAYESLTLDGSYMDFTACADAKCDGNGISILAGDLFDDSLSKFDSGLKDGSPVMLVSMLSNKPLTFDSAFWYASTEASSTQAKQTNPDKPGPENVPEPPAAALFGLGVLCVRYLRRSRKA